MRSITPPVPHLRLPGPQAVHVWMVDGHPQQDSRGLLLDLLATYEDGPDPPVRYVEGAPRGKPRLSGSEDDLGFNLSRTSGMQLVAIGRAPVGADIERIRPLDQLERTATRFLTGAEIRAIRAIASDELRAVALTRRWTVKEAVAKGLGLGLDLPLNRIAFDPGTSVAVAPAGTSPRRWRVTEFSETDGIVGALAVPDSGQRVSVQRFRASTGGQVSLRRRPSSPDTRAAVG